MVGRMLLPLVLRVFVGHHPSPTTFPEPIHDASCLTEPVHRHLFGAPTFDPTPLISDLLRHHLFSPSPLGRLLRGILLRYIVSRLLTCLHILSLLPIGLLRLFFPSTHWTHTPPVQLPSITPLQHVTPVSSPSPSAAPPSFHFPLRLTSGMSPLPLALNAHITRSDFDPDFVATLLSRTPGADVVDIILDTGCTISITPDKRDFVTYKPARVSHVQTVKNGPTALVGTGIVRWTLISEDGQQMDLLIPCHHVPASSICLLSPQDFCQFNGFDRTLDQFGGNSNYFWMYADHQRTRFQCPIDPRSNLPVALAKTPCNPGGVSLLILSSLYLLILPAHLASVKVLSTCPSSMRPIRTSLPLKRISYSGIFVSATSASHIFSI